MPNLTGRAWLVGAGPGDPSLLTLAGRDALAAAEVVLYDALLHPAVLDFAPADALRIPVGKRAGAHSVPQHEINRLLVDHVRAGRRVVRLKGGDPFVFGRGGEEALALREAGLPFTVIPGVTSAVAVPAAAGIPVTHRGLATRFTVLTGAESTGEPPADLPPPAVAGTLVILMGAAHLPSLVDRLLALGWDPATPAASIAHGTLPAQQSVVGTLGEIAGLAASLPTPLITVVGRVVELAGLLGPGRFGPLAGRSVVVTRSRSQSSALAEMLRNLGADVIEAPAIAITLRPGAITIDERSAGRWDWIVVTSQNSAAALFAALDAAGRDIRALGTARIAAVGEATAAALAARSVRPDFLPSRATSAVLAEELPRVNGARVLLPISALAGPELEDALRRRGAHVERIDAYHTTPVPLDPALLPRILEADAITFTSASTAAFLAEALGEARPSPSVRLVSIGPSTSATVRARFGRVDAEAATPGLPQLVAALLEVLA
ncbi:uroporphyrinogen-III C-methyltransferase [Tepidiforma sp.]|uniref:uroporphyrinogen-III C-methyltransferase n=1 Tax=Tepidiforma sp. TaxID=2682230 RepID=UPI002ADE14F6|nr:uroporphyrinogen-III C-methyltransferase [Tepidiforma sp.]